VVFINPVRDRTPKVSDGCLRQPVSNGVNTKKALKIGEFARVKITDTLEYDLVGEVES